MYHPVVGTFLSRDPLPPADQPVLMGNSLYAYVGDNPINRVDPTGLKEIDSGVKECLGYLKGHWIWDIFSSHGFIAIDDTGYGFFEVGLNVTGTGDIRDNDLIVYPNVPPTAVTPGSGYSVCTTIMIDDCCVDREKFREAMRSFIASCKSNPGSYIAGIRDCFGFQREALNHAYQNAGKECCELYSPPMAAGAPTTYIPPVWVKKPGYTCK